MSTYDPIPFDHTYIMYDPKDPVAIIAVHFSLLPIYVMVFYTGWFLVSREIEPVIVVGGHLVGEVLNKILKKLLRLPRPDFHKNFGTGSLTFGMPLAHSQFMGFLAAYFICVFLFKIPTMDQREKLLGCGVLFFLSLFVAYSRVYLFYHTIQQVFVGLLFGALLGLFYFTIISIARDVGFIDWILNWPIVHWFYVKDSYFHNYQSFADEYDHYKDLMGSKK